MPKIALFSVLASSVGLNVAALSVFMFVLFAFFAFHLLTNRSPSIQGRMMYFALFLGIFILVNAYWFIPLAAFIAALQLSAGEAVSVFKTFDILNWTSSNNSVFNVIRQHGDVFWFDGYGGEPYYPFFSQYQNNVYLIAISLMLPLLAYSSLLFKRREAPFFAVISIIGSVLSQGVHPPFGVLFSWLMANVPGFWIFRAPWQRWTIPITIAYSVLAALTLSELFKIFVSKIQKPTKTTGQSRYFYYDFADSYATWRKFEISLRDFARVGVPSWSSIYTMKMTFRDALGPRTGLFHHDKIGVAPGVASFNLKLEQEGLFEFLIPRSSVTNPVLTVDSVQILLTQANSSSFAAGQARLDPRPHSINLKNVQGVSPWLLVRSALNSSEQIRQPIVSFERINPTNFRVHIKSNSPFFLVLSEPYDVGWKAYYRATDSWKSIIASPLDENYHLIANGFANSWYIERTGEFDITLFFQPQAFFHLGLALAVITTSVAFRVTGIPVALKVVRRSRRGIALRLYSAKSDDIVQDTSQIARAFSLGICLLSKPVPRNS